jgi:DNA-binding transcriptional LysR family regulator
MGNLSQLEIFVYVVETGSFTAAAQALEVSKAHVSKQIRALEDRLGARLLNRTTRKVAPTDIGASFYDRCRRVLDDLSDAESTVTDLQTTPRGSLRVTAPSAFGVAYVAPALVDFMTEHDELHVDMSFNDRSVDLVEEGFDLGIRLGHLPDSSLIAKRLAQTCTTVCGSPEYFARRGRPQVPADLREHDCLRYAYQTSGHSWRMQDEDGEEATVPVDGRVVANDGDALLTAARRGLGVCFLPDFYVAEDLASGALQRVLPHWSTPTPVWAIYPHNRHLSAKVRLFVDFLAARFEAPPWAITEAQREHAPKRRAGVNP